MKTSLTKSLGIFWSENSVYMIWNALYSFFICAVSLLLVHEFQISDVSLMTLLYADISLCFLATTMFAVSLLTVGWFGRHLGGELVAFFISSVMTFVIILLFIMHQFELMELLINNQILIGIIKTVLLMAPSLVFQTLILIFASGYKN